MPHLRNLLGIGRFAVLWVLLLFTTISSWAGESSDFSEPIETLEVIEVTGTKVSKAPRTLSFSLPSLNPPWRATSLDQLHLPDLHIVKVLQAVKHHVLLDPIGKARGEFTSVKPLKVERPLYPRMAREQGWQGKVVLRTHITPEGTVKKVTVQESSGFPVLDESAMQAVNLWAFEPAKNGEFAVSSTVDLPIRFDLRQ